MFFSENIIEMIEKLISKIDKLADIFFFFSFSFLFFSFLFVAIIRIRNGKHNNIFMLLIVKIQFPFTSHARFSFVFLKVLV